MTATKFNEILAIMDDQSWIWGLVSRSLSSMNLEHVRLPSTVPIRQSWTRFRNAERIIIHWESKGRSGGAIVEEIIDVARQYDVSERVVVLTTNPTHEDVVYFAELGLRRIIRLRNREQDLRKAATELQQHTRKAPVSGHEVAWRKWLRAVDRTPEDADDEILERLEKGLEKLEPSAETARYLDAKACLLALKGEADGALKNWLAALDINPNYYRSYTKLIDFHRKQGDLKSAMGLMRKMQELNKSNISRLVCMGEIQMELNDTQKAEHYFKSALARDNYCSGALNGLAEIRFHQGELDESRELLSRSHLAYRAAQTLNRQGITMVQAGEYAEALDHYTKAQFVLPQQDKGPMLFYNIALCYSRWGRPEMAKDFLQIALIKEPNYKKAQRLLDTVTSRTEVSRECA